MSQSERTLRETRDIIKHARKQAKENLRTNVKRLQVEAGKLQDIANRLTDIATVIAVANGIDARVKQSEQDGEQDEAGEGED